MVLIACDSEDAWDCVQTPGDLVVQEFFVDPFEGIRIEDNFDLVVSQGEEVTIQVEAGENLLSDIRVEVSDGILFFQNQNGCGLLRNPEPLTAYVTTPVLQSLRTSGSGEIRSDGVLNFPLLALFSNTSADGANGIKSGDFYLDVECDRLVITANGQSGFYLEGSAMDGSFNFGDELPLLEAPDLHVQRLRIFQRSANKMVVRPIQSLVGEIRGTGDVMAVQRPEIVDVQEFFSGRLIFQD